VTTDPLGRARIELVGRAAEIAAIGLLLDGAAQQGGVLVVRGDAGIGKSALLDRAREMAGGHGFKVLAATGVESEAILPYAGLHQLVHPMLDGVPQLPTQLRGALLAAFGMRDGEVADRFLTALTGVGTARRRRSSAATARRRRRRPVARHPDR
jgi:hypothetical protein